MHQVSTLGSIQSENDPFVVAETYYVDARFYKSQPSIDQDKESYLGTTIKAQTFLDNYTNAMTRL